MRPIPTLRTARFVLRPFRLEDAEVVTQLLNDERVSETLEGIPYPYYRDYADHWIGTHDSLFQETGELHLAIELAPSRELLGAVGLLPRGAERPPHLGYWLGRRYWGHGYATKAVGALVRYALAELSVGTIAARCMVDNPASAAVLSKVGLRRTGRCPEPILKNGLTREVDEFTLTVGQGERAV